MAIEDRGERRGKVAAVIEERRDEISSRWLVRVQKELSIVNIDATELRDAIPDYVEGIAGLIGKGVSDVGDGESLWQRVATEHAVTRVRQGFDVDEVIREFMVLRRVLWEVLDEAGRLLEASAEVTDIVEAAMGVTVHRYVEHRDVEARRAEVRTIAYLSHELRNPLATAAMAADQIPRVGDLAPGQTKLLRIVERSHKRARELLDRVLTMERAEAGELEPARETIRLEPFMQEVVSGPKAVAESRGLGLSLDCDPEIELSIDRRLTASALENLVDNAVKYTEEGEVKVWASALDDAVEVHVVDHCGGLSAAERRNLFTPFRRGEHRDQPGTGLGLAIAKRAIEAQSGSLDVAAAERGCDFHIRLPGQAPPRA